MSGHEGGGHGGAKFESAVLEEWVVTVKDTVDAFCSFIFAWLNVVGLEDRGGGGGGGGHH
ncbi:MAG: hypothetical protein KBD46_01365 [Candidatus Levybacteria bacterium]|nr:hypothetical protein [Candidatus Levybacteria bacterium]